MDFLEAIKGTASNMFRGASYISNFEENLLRLGNELEKLLAQMDLVKMKVDSAERQGMIIGPGVDFWLPEAQRLRNEVVELLKEGDKLVGKKCPVCCHPKNCWSRSKMGKKIARKQSELIELRQSGNPYRVAFPTPLTSIHKVPTEMTVGLDSTFAEVWGCLKDEAVGIIGIYGMGGVGKTVLMRQITCDALFKTGLDFDVVIWAQVTQNVNIDRIQDDIRRGLELSGRLWENKSTSARAGVIFSLLSKMNFVLLLDDIWSPLDLSLVGIPVLPPLNRDNNSKVVFTTRSKDVCAAMNADRHIPVNPVSFEEGLKLFTKTVGQETLDSHPEIPQLARDIVGECSGLPLGIVTVGRALVRRNHEVWMDVAKSLHRLTQDASDTTSEVFRVLKSSYDHLSNDYIKRCFIYCSLFPEDYSIDGNQLIDYWIGEGFLGDQSDDIDNARNRGYSIIEKLKSLCLLLGEGSSVKMHEVVRDCALWIAGGCEKKEHKFLVKAGVHLSEAPEVEQWEEAERISLMDNRIEKLSGTPKCHKLVTLILAKNSLKTITGGFFQFMPSLRVLDLSSCEMSEIPKEVIYLVGLQYLNLSHTNISRLPVEFKSLVKLKVLDLSYIAELDVIPQEVIAGLLSLQVLNMYCCGSYGDWIVEGGDDLLVGSTEFIDALKDLKLLNHLGIGIKDVQALEKLARFHKLQGSTHSLLIVRCEGLSSLELSSIRFMERLSMLEIRDCADLVEIKIIDQLMEAGEISSVRLRDVYFYNLEHVKIEGCWLLEELTWLSYVPNLQTLDIDRCMNLKEVVDSAGDVMVEVEGTPSVFSRLRRIRLSNLPELSCISVTAISLPSLEEISVSFCPKLKILPVESTSGANTLTLIQAQRSWWNQLEWKDESIKNAFLPHFKEIE